MIFKDDKNLKYKAVKKNGKYYLLTMHYYYDNKVHYKIEVEGKENVLIYIKNNKLKRCEI